MEMYNTKSYFFVQPQDDYQRIKEGIASILVGNMLQNTDIPQQNILNPNMTEVKIIASKEFIKLLPYNNACC